MENNNEKKPLTKFDKEILKGICIALSIIFIFSAGNMVGALTSKNSVAKTEESSMVAADTNVADTTAAPAITTAPATQAPATTPAPADTTAAAASAGTTAAPAAADTTAAPAASDTTAAASSGAPQSKAEIVALFNEGANKIKTSAKKVTRNYEDLQNNPDKLEVPSILKSIGNSLLNRFLVKDENPVVYEGDQITAELPVKGQSFVSKTTEADLVDATCTDDGTSYNVTLKYVSGTDPTDGVANAFNLMNPDDVYSNAPMVSSFSVDYYDGVIECKIDKATGNVTWIKYTNPMVMSVKAMGVDAKVGMTFIDDYSVEY